MTAASTAVAAPAATTSASPAGHVHVSEMVAGSVFAIETAQTFGPVAAPLRAVVVRLRDGRAVVYNALSDSGATEAILELVNSLGCK